MTDRGKHRKQPLFARLRRGKERRVLMEERVWNGKETEEEERLSSDEDAGNRLRAAAYRIVPDESVGERIIEGVKAGKRNRRLAPGIPAAVFAACLLLSILYFKGTGVIGEEVVVYAATEEHGWQKLVEGERILLKKEPYQTLEEGEEPFYDNGRSAYYPYICTFRVEVPENYVYDKQMVIIRDDDILEFGDRLEWWVAPERPEDAGRIMKGAFRLWIVDENRERQAALELELTKEDGKCYAELRRVWESKAYKKNRHKNWVSGHGRQL